MERVVVFTTDEATVLVGLLDMRWSGVPEDDPLVEVVRYYTHLLNERITAVDEEDNVPLALLARAEASRAESVRLRREVTERISESRELRARRDDLVHTAHLALAVLGTTGPLRWRPADDPALVDLRARLCSVTAA
jgi:hypothetical protein